jgi:hypothetical protein
MAYLNELNAAHVPPTQPLAECALRREQQCDGDCPWVGVEGVHCLVFGVKANCLVLPRLAKANVGKRTVLAVWPDF